MNSDTINDLKQFISATVRQEVSYLDEKFEARFDQLDEKIDDMALAIGEAFESHEDRLIRLEAEDI